MKLVIVESPAKAKTIEKYLGTGYKVLASVGHVRDLPKSNKHAIDIEGGFIPHYEIVKGKEKVLAELKRAAAKAEEIYLATDPDREGEAIAWHLAQALNLTPSKKGASASVKRVTFNEITKEAVRDAFTHPRTIDENLRQAQEARRVLDRLVGYDLSGLIWQKVRYGLSAGRVQSPALRILMEREREIRAFVPEDYWVLTATLRGAGGAAVYTCVEEPRDLTQAEHILSTARTGPWHVVSVKESKQKRSPYPPFTTSTLQQAASTRLGFSPARTMAIAQRLYEAGHITYMRTDSPTLSRQALGLIAQTIEQTFGKEHLEVRNFTTKAKTAQEAHEAIRPTAPAKEHAGATDEQKRLYALIRTRTLASQMKDAQLMKTKITANVAGAPMPDFTVSGSRTLYPGWLAADPAASGEDVELPQVTEGEHLALVSAESEAKCTTPPHRYTEAGLIKELEKRGIGRPSTYATIMKNLADRGYVEKTGKTLQVTDTGDVVSTFLEQNFARYISDSFTADMEDELDLLANGERAYEPTLRTFYTDFHSEVERKRSIEKLTNLGPAPEAFTCPLCSAAMVYKLGRGGKFMSCSRYPECDGARTEAGTLVEPDKPVGTYPPTGEPIFVLEGRFGPYVQVGDPKQVKTKTGTRKKGPAVKPKRASIPKGKDPSAVTLEDALLYLSLPRVLGAHPETGEPITASVGRFGPYIVYQSDFRSLKTDDVYTIDLPRALEILAEPKKVGRGRFAARKKKAA